MRNTKFHKKWISNYGHFGATLVRTSFLSLPFKLLRTHGQAPNVIFEANEISTYMCMFGYMRQNANPYEYASVVSIFAIWPKETLLNCTTKQYDPQGPSDMRQWIMEFITMKNKLSSRDSNMASSPINTILQLKLSGNLNLWHKHFHRRNCGL